MTGDDVRRAPRAWNRYDAKGEGCPACETDGRLTEHSYGDECRWKAWRSVLLGPALLGDAMNPPDCSCEFVHCSCPTCRSTAPSRGAVPESQRIFPAATADQEGTDG